MKEDRKRLRIW